MELLIGAGADHEKKLCVNGKRAWSDLVTVDMNPAHKPTVVHDLETLPYPFDDDTFDEVHAYDVLEHTGKQGDWRFFFTQWSELWRITKPGGYFCGWSPDISSIWAWGDPGHTRIMSAQMFVFLDQSEYTKQVGVTAMSDYRRWYRADWRPHHVGVDRKSQLVFILQAIKPSRIAGDVSQL